MKKYCHFIILFILLLCSQSATAGYIRWATAPNTYNDHANVNNHSSIGHLLSISQPGDEVYIGHSGNYRITTPLVMKEGVTLKAMVSGVNVFFGVSQLAHKDQIMVNIQGNFITIDRITFDGEHRAKNIVYNNPDLVYHHLTLKNCIFKSTRPGRADGDVLMLQKVNNLHIENCGIYDASNPTAFGIKVVHSNDVLIKNSIIADTGLHGIYLPGAHRVRIEGCEITRTGMDGITGYHSSDHWNRRDFVIVNNHIHHTAWHGIHVSGEGIYIRNNDIHDVVLTSIYVGDQREDDYYQEDSREVTIWDNRIQKGHVNIAHFKPDPDTKSWMPAVEVNFWNNGNSYTFGAWDSSKDLIVGLNTYYYSGAPCHLVNSSGTVEKDIHININNPRPGATSRVASAMKPDKEMSSIERDLLSINLIYPNPVVASANIEFTLAKASIVKVYILDQTGRLVKKLIDQQKLHSGQHTVRWNTTNESGVPVSNGHYFYFIQAGAQTKVKRLIISR
ncbi:right-handed parallel beta-helix repeat-containing protein [uncultured Microscilla sp.]|uniref:right-handed parallel beta-helix repeat-containing protein n=1 Tax=uncultured Microscilla sp. TaxID=432653 RepID=UPI0026381EB5|nr:right-handed parallel beta-helix repeat-containing protein [uncultured Microscilla sp.]